MARVLLAVGLLLAALAYIIWWVAEDTSVDHWVRG